MGPCEAGSVVTSKNCIPISRVRSLLGASFYFFVVNNFIVFCFDKEDRNGDFTYRFFSGQPHFRVHEKACNGSKDKHFSRVGFAPLLDSRFSAERVVRFNILQDFNSG